MNPARYPRPGLRHVVRRDGSPFDDELSAALAVRHRAEQWFGPLNWRPDGLHADLPDCRLSLLCSVLPCWNQEAGGWYGTVLATPFAVSAPVGDE